MNTPLSYKAQRYGAWQKTLCLGLSLFFSSANPGARGQSRFTRQLRKIRGADATINQASPNANSGGAATLIRIEIQQRSFKPARHRPV